MRGFQDITDQQFAILAFNIMGMFSRQKQNKTRIKHGDKVLTNV